MDYYKYFYDLILKNNWIEFDRKDNKKWFCHKKSFSKNSKFKYVESKLSKNLDCFKITSSFFEYFSDSEDRVIKSNKIVPSLFKTLFIVSSIQTIIEYTYNSYKNNQTYICAQPVIRVKFIKSLNLDKGYGTSLINLTTARYNLTPEEHFQLLERWLSWLSSLGFYIPNIILRLRSDEQNWGFGKYNNVIIDFYYNNNQIGDAVYLYDFPLPNGVKVNLSDIGSSAERIGWLLSQTKNYFDFIGPCDYSRIINHAILDNFRSLILLTLSGIKSGNKNREYQYYRLASQVHFTIFLKIDINNLISFYYSQWKNIILPEKTLSFCQNHIYHTITDIVNNKYPSDKLNNSFKSKAIKYVYQK